MSSVVFRRCPQGIFLAYATDSQLLRRKTPLRKDTHRALRVDAYLKLYPFLLSLGYLESERMGDASLKSHPREELM